MSKIQHFFQYRGGVSLSARHAAPVTQDLGWSEIDGPPLQHPAAEPYAEPKPQLILYSQNLEKSRQDFLRSAGKISANISAQASGPSFYGVAPDGYGIMVWSDR